MNNSIPRFFMLAFLGLTRTTLWARPVENPINSDLVEEYRAEKDSDSAHILQLYNDAKYPTEERDKQDRQELRDLESRLRPMLKQPTFKHPPVRSAIHMETLLPAPGYACLDGLDYFFTASPNFPQRVFLSDLALMGDGSARTLPDVRQRFLDRIQCDDSTHTHYGPVRNLRKGIFDEVYAELSLAAQDIGPFPPNELSVLARKGTQIYEFVIPTQDPALSVEACNSKFHEATSPEDKSEENSFNQLTACYADHLNHAQNDPALKKLRTAAEAILAQIKP